MDGIGGFCLTCGFVMGGCGGGDGNRVRVLGVCEMWVVVGFIPLMPMTRDGGGWGVDADSLSSIAREGGSCGLERFVV